MHKNRIQLFIFLLCLFTIIGCRQHYVVFYASNKSSDTILIQYQEQITGDTLIVEMYPIPSSDNYGYSHTFIRRPVDENNYDWNSIYTIHIQSVKNLAGDTINFDPNLPSNWKYNQGQSFYSYHLLIDDASF
jgi:hypothetical protein